MQPAHAFLRALCSGLVPFVPSIGETLIDLIPQDVAAQAIVALLRSEPNDDGERGSEHWITAGAEAPTAEEMVVACLEVLRRSLAGGARVSARLTVRATDAAGNAASARRRVSLSR